MTLGEFELTSGGAGAWPALFVARLDPNGEPVWVAQSDGVDRVDAWAVSVLPDGSSVVGGSFEETLGFGAAVLTSAGASDGFVARLDADGQWLWAAQGQSEGLVRVLGLTVLADGSVAATGSVEGQASFGPRWLRAPTDLPRAFVATLTSDGQWASAAQSEGPGRSVASEICQVPAGRVVVTGSYRDQVGFGPISSPSSWDWSGFAWGLPSR